MKTLWTPEHILCLRTHYTEPDGPVIIVEETGHTYEQVKSKANRLGMYRGTKGEFKTKGLLKEYKMNPDLADKLRSGKCPGKFAYCGNPLLKEVVYSESGHSTELIDLVCFPAHHRFPIPPKKKEENEGTKVSVAFVIAAVKASNPKQTQKGCLRQPQG